MTYDSINYRGLQIRFEHVEESDCDWHEAIIYRSNGDYLTDYPPRVWFSNQIDCVKRWIDRHFNLLNACNRL